MGPILWGDVDEFYGFVGKVGVKIIFDKDDDGLQYFRCDHEHL